jgi:hypothetical protein
MRRSLCSLAAILTLAILAAIPSQARASWLSEALHDYVDRYAAPGYYGPAPVYGYDPDYVAPPTGYYSYYSYPAYPYTYTAPGYYRPWYRDGHAWHEWRDHHDHGWHGHSDWHHHH